MRIKTEDLTHNYKQHEFALNGVNLEFSQGEFVAFLGHNGSGKSTFAKHLNAILLPSGGQVLVDGLDTKDQNLIFEIRKRCGMVFQNPDNQLVATIVEEDVAFAPENLGLPTEEIRKRVDDALKAVGMSEFATYAPHNLSGGQKQRIAIAGILAMKPSCIVLDEPTAMLDPNGRKAVLDTVLDLSKKENITVILITHHMNEAVLADRVVVMNKGEVFLDDTPEKIFVQVEKLQSVGLFVPQTVEILYNLKKAGANIEINAFDELSCAKILKKYLEE
ncbi:MAG: energy-coupling factor transporter ATPase [Clostridia bacterium]